MCFPACASAVLLAVLSVLQASAPASSDLRELRWIRANVTASSPDSITLQLRDREITLLRDAATEIVGADPALAIGATVEAHYSDRKGIRSAILLIADAGPGEISKRAGTSLRGTMPHLKHGALSVTSAGKSRDGLAFEKKSRLVDRDGRLLATGKDAIAKILAPDADVLVKYNNAGGVIVDGLDLGGNDNIVEIRLLR